MTIKPFGFWMDWENVETEIKRVIKKNKGQFPTQKYLNEHGYSSLSGAIMKYHGGFRKIRVKLGYEIINQDPALLRDINWLSEQLNEIIDKDNGEYPTNTRLKELERYDLTWAIHKYHGGINSVREQMGYHPIQTSPEVLKDWVWVSKELKKVIRKNNGEFPTETHLGKIGRGDLTTAITRHQGGFGEVQRKMGYEPKLTPSQKLQDWEYIATELKNLTKQNKGRFPSQKFLYRIGRSGLIAAIQKYHGGMMVAREKLGVEYDQHPMGTQKNWNWLKSQLEQIIQENDGEFPSYTVLNNMGRSDVRHSIQKYHGGSSTVREKFGYKPSRTKPEDAKNWKWVSSELKNIIKENKGEFPSFPYLSSIDRNDLVSAITRHHGGVNKARIKMGYELPRNPPGKLNDWSWVRQELRAIIKENEGEFPTQIYLAEHGRTDLSNAMSKYHGGINAARKKMGFGYRQNPRGYLEDWRNIESELKTIIKKIGHFPSGKELEKLGKSSLDYAIGKYHGGMFKVREKMGHESPRRENYWWKDLNLVIEEAKIAMEKLGYEDLPPQQILSRNGYGHLNRAINQYGGFPEFRNILHERLGIDGEDKKLEGLLKDYVSSRK